MFRCLTARPEHGVKVTNTFFRTAHIIKQGIKNGLVHHALFTDPRRGNADTFLINLFHSARKRSRCHATDIVPVATHRGKKRQFSFVEYGVQQQHIVQMRTTGIGVVMQKQIALVNIVFKHFHDFTC